MDSSRLLRKSSYGRTQLFLQDSEVMFREVKCMGGIVRRDVANVYHTLPDARGVSGSACWHCCEMIDNEDHVIPLPRVYDATEHVYHVYGRTCSPACAKAYIIEHTTFDRGQHMNTLVQMLRNVYNVSGPILEAPPRPAMKRFGGSFDPGISPKATCRLVQPPFVSYCMIVEEQHCETQKLPVLSEMDVEDADTFEEPLPPAMFDTYLQKRTASTREGGESSTPQPKKSRSQGPMSKFFK